MTSEDAQFLETRKFQLEEICRIFRVPLHMIQNTDRATFNNIENLGIGLSIIPLVPYLTRIETTYQCRTGETIKTGCFYAKFLQGIVTRRYGNHGFDALCHRY